MTCPDSDWESRIAAMWGESRRGPAPSTYLPRYNRSVARYAQELVEPR